MDETGQLSYEEVRGWIRRFAGQIVANKQYLTELDSAASQSSQAPRKPGDFARSALAVADRRPLLRPAVRAVRVGYWSAKAVLRPDRSD